MSRLSASGRGAGQLPTEAVGGRMLFVEWSLTRREFVKDATEAPAIFTIVTSGLSRAFGRGVGRGSPTDRAGEAEPGILKHDLVACRPSTTNQEAARRDVAVHAASPV